MEECLTVYSGEIKKTFIMDALKRCFEFRKMEMAPENEIKKIYTETFVSDVADLILKLELTDIKLQRILI